MVGLVSGGKKQVTREEGTEAEVTGTLEGQAREAEQIEKLGKNATTTAREGGRKKKENPVMVLTYKSTVPGIQ